MAERVQQERESTDHAAHAAAVDADAELAPVQVELGDWDPRGSLRTRKRLAGCTRVPQARRYPR